MIKRKGIEQLVEQFRFAKLKLIFFRYENEINDKKNRKLMNIFHESHTNLKQGNKPCQHNK